MFAEAIVDLAMNSEKRRKLGQNGKIFVYKNFNFNTTISKYIDIYKNG